ncbi:hypothetical protein RB598_002382 [Gaeumannomyces tritici]
MLGGPGSGKGLQCQRLVRSFDVEHISIGDVLRDEMSREGSGYAAVIRENMVVGTVGPKETTVGILKSRILASAAKGARVFLLDGFPRNLDQSDYFEAVVCPIKTVILLECSDEVMLARLLPRARFDDVPENIQRRIRTFRATTSLVVDSFRERGKVQVVDAEETPDQVAAAVSDLFSELAETGSKKLEPMTGSQAECQAEGAGTIISISSQ